MEEFIKNNYKKLIIIIFILAIIVRVVFILEVKATEVQYDVCALEIHSHDDYDKIMKEYYTDDLIEGRHISYILYIHDNWQLPNKIIGQFYHPPLHHFICAVFMKCTELFTNDSEIIIESLQILPLIYSVIMLYAFYRILCELNVGEKGKLFFTTVAAFYPINIMMSGAINNDTLVTMFAVLVILYTIKWEKSASFKDAFLISLFFGLGMLTKTSMAVMIVFPVYIYFKLLSSFINKNLITDVKKLLVQLLIFVVIGGGLSLSFHIARMMDGFNTIGIIEAKEAMSLADYSLYRRYGFTNIFKMDDANMYNSFLYTQITYLRLAEVNISALICVVIATLFVLLGIYYLIKNAKENVGLIITYVAWWVGFIYLNISMPYSCSNNARYMIIPILIELIAMAMGLEKEKSKNMKNIIYTICSIFILFSISFIIQVIKVFA